MGNPYRHAAQARPAAGLDVDSRAVFIQRTYSHLFGAIMAFVLLEVFLFKVGIAESMLEIAPGYGRWTAFLKDLCSRLPLVDLSPKCIEACRERFGESDDIAYHVNDGRSPAMIDEDSIDFAFSFDSLVHVELEVLES